MHVKWEGRQVSICAWGPELYGVHVIQIVLTCAVCSCVLHVQWEGRHLKLTAVYARGDPGFTVHMTFNLVEDYNSAFRQISMCWPPEVTAAAIAALDETMGFRPLAARGT